MPTNPSCIRHRNRVESLILLVNGVLCVLVHLMHGVSVGWWGIDRLLPQLHLLAYHCMTILPLITGIAVLLAVIAFRFHARAAGTSLRDMVQRYVAWPTLLAAAGFLLITFPWGHRIKGGQWISEPWMWLFYRWILLLLVLFQLFVWFSGRVSSPKKEPAAGTFTAHLSPLSWLRVLLLTLIVFAETNIISWNVLEHVAHVEDGIAQLFQAKTYSIGKWYLEPPPVPDAFRYPHIVLEDKWYSIYPPGFAMVLALGVLFNAPWVINPIIAGLTVPVIYLYGKQIYDRKTALFASGLLCISPFFLMMGAGMMNHPLALLVLLLFALTLEYSKKYRAGFLLSGFLAGYAFMTRPLTALGIGIPLVAFVLYEERKNYLHIIKGSLLLLLGVLPCVAIMFLSNIKTTGDPLVSGYQKYFDNNPLGFGWKPWGDNPAGFVSSREVYHTPLQGLANVNINLAALNRDLLGWPIAGLFPILYLWMRRQKPDYRDWKMLCVCLGLCVAYVFYYYQDLCYGPRNIVECVPFAILLIARGLYVLYRDVKEKLSISELRMKCIAFVTICFMLFAAAITTVPRLYDRYWRNYWRVTGELRSLVLKSDLDDGIVFVHPTLNYGNGFQLNPPDMRTGPLFAEDLGPKIRAAVIAAYPDRDVYYSVEDFVEDGRAIPEIVRHPPD